MDNKLTKVTMNLSDRSIKNVERLSFIMGESNRTRVVSSSLEIAKSILEYIEDGNMLIIQYKNGEQKGINFIY